MRKYLIAGLTGVLTSVLALAGPAHASLDTDWDHFDNNAAARWQFSYSGSSYSGGVNSTGANGWLAEFASGSGWGSLGRSVYLWPVAYHSTSCGMQINLRTTTAGQTSKVNVEVIRPADWTYLSLKQVTVGNTAVNVQVPPWVNGPSTVYFRVSLLGDTSAKVLQIDDLFWACSY
ncbi:hypothetical protein [Actinoplanes sp. N902-109]|uniref:hypothetical protein n=1 Tax=Actinoplanes sp. (strain N902-109) TaxID=649831 RepID=UPI00032946CC|nr:hypothetical protein [Actinoplanes sp. N902-109]AGL18902.1 hypothetical protein L083_5392 [Actinoplanes sp. N902-109]